MILGIARCCSWPAAVGGCCVDARVAGEAEMNVLRATSYEVTDADGELAGFDYDNPVMDLLRGTVLNNTLTANRVQVPHGKHITPASAANVSEDRQ